jgi:Predicted soluble lytic transglycosylase fused to an ABC-type amino acid-binding protein
MGRYCGILFSLLLLFVSCKGLVEKDVYDFPQIKESGVLRAVTLYNSTTFFQYRTDTMGYEYDLVRNFADFHGLELSVSVVENEEALINIIKTGGADVVAYPVFINNNLKQDILFCGHEIQTSQVLVQRSNKGDKLLTDVVELLGKEVHVIKGSKYAQRLHHQNQELGGGIIIHEVDSKGATVEDLIERVSKGEIAYTISDDNLARVCKTYFWNIDINFKISFPQRSSWVVNIATPALADSINVWAEDIQSKRIFRSAEKRYFELSKAPADIKYEIPEGHISPFDSIFKKHAASLGWDWQLLASIAYQESRFNPTVVSWAGAEGMMGIMPRTARGFGVNPHELHDPDISVQTAVLCLKFFRSGLTDIKDDEERMKFTIAAYNAGLGHVYDAQRLASLYGYNPHVWHANVADYVLLKNDPAYYNNPVCRHGYLRGAETFNYVYEVMDRYLRYLEETS